MKKLTNLVAVLSVATAIQTVSMAKLLVTPTRIDLNNSNKVQALKLINESNEEVTYRIEYMYQNMNADGSYTKLSDAEIGNRSEIEKMVMYSPRQVTLQPKQTQTVRFALRRKEGATGEINAHVLFKEMQKKSAVPQLAKKSEDGEFSIEIKPLFNIAIPVIVSDANKNTKMMASMSNVRVDNVNKVVAFQINNTGKYSPYGRAEVKFYKGRRLLGSSELNGLGVMLPLKTRTISINYAEKDFANDEISHVEIVYASAPESGKSYTIAEGRADVK